jgi:hypothetical protein
MAHALNLLLQEYDVEFWASNVVAEAMKMVRFKRACHALWHCFINIWQSWLKYWQSRLKS